MSRRILDLWPWPRTAQLFSKLQENFMGNKTVANTPLRKKKGLIKGLLKDHGANENIHFIRPYFLRDLALEGGGLLRFLWKHQPQKRADVLRLVENEIYIRHFAKTKKMLELVCENSIGFTFFLLRQLRLKQNLEAMISYDILFTDTYNCFFIGFLLQVWFFSYTVTAT